MKSTGWNVCTPRLLGGGNVNCYLDPILVGVVENDISDAVVAIAPHFLSWNEVSGESA